MQWLSKRHKITDILDLYQLPLTVKVVNDPYPWDNDSLKPNTVLTIHGATKVDRSICYDQAGRLFNIPNGFAGKVEIKIANRSRIFKNIENVCKTKLLPKCITNGKEFEVYEVKFPKNTLFEVKCNDEDDNLLGLSVQSLGPHPIRTTLPCETEGNFREVLLPYDENRLYSMEELANRKLPIFVEFKRNSEEQQTLPSGIARIEETGACEMIYATRRVRNITYLAIFPRSTKTMVNIGQISLEDDMYTTIAEPQKETIDVGLVKMYLKTNPFQGEYLNVVYNDLKDMMANKESNVFDDDYEVPVISPPTPSAQVAQNSPRTSAEGAPSVSESKFIDVKYMDAPDETYENIDTCRPPTMGSSSKTFPRPKQYMSQKSPSASKSIMKTSQQEEYIDMDASLISIRHAYRARSMGDLLGIDKEESNNNLQAENSRGTALSRRTNCPRAAPYEVTDILKKAPRDIMQETDTDPGRDEASSSDESKFAGDKASNHPPPLPPKRISSLKKRTSLDQPTQTSRPVATLKPLSCEKPQIRDIRMKRSRSLHDVFQETKEKTQEMTTKNLQGRKAFTMKHKRSGHVMESTRQQTENAYSMIGWPVLEANKDVGLKLEEDSASLPDSASTLTLKSELISPMEGKRKAPIPVKRGTTNSVKAPASQIDCTPDHSYSTVHRKNTERKPPPIAPRPRNLRLKPYRRPKEKVGDAVEVAKDAETGELHTILEAMNLGAYEEKLSLSQVDVVLLADLEEDDLVKDIEMKKFEARKLLMYVKEGWRPDLQAKEDFNIDKGNEDPEKWSNFEVEMKMRDGIKLQDFAKFCLENQVDGKLLLKILEKDMIQSIRDDFGIRMTKIEETKLNKFLLQGWRPR